MGNVSNVDNVGNVEKSIRTGKSVISLKIRVLTNINMNKCRIPQSQTHKEYILCDSIRIKIINLNRKMCDFVIRKK